MDVQTLASWIHETSFACKKTVEKKDGKWQCKDCLHTARQAMFLIGQELTKGLTEKVGY